ncbi:MAG: VOC family protein [Reichenbachiella sp.]
MTKFSIFILLLISSTICPAQNKPYNFTFDHYAINVADLNRSVAFYQKYFFVEEIEDGTKKENIRWFSLGNNQELHIIMVSNLDIKIPKGVHMALTIGDLDKYITFLEMHKTEYFNWPGDRMRVSTRPDNVRQIYIQDPDGYWIEINNGITRFKG